jgi:hypothetical protein
MILPSLLLHSSSAQETGIQYKIGTDRSPPIVGDWSTSDSVCRDDYDVVISHFDESRRYAVLLVYSQAVARKEAL